jgi:hypothetical protein
MISFRLKRLIPDFEDASFGSGYVPSTQYGEIMGWSKMMQRTKAAPAAMTNAVRQTVDSLGHEYLAAKTHMIVETIDRSILRERIFAILSELFGGLALLLAGIRLYGRHTTSPCAPRKSVCADRPRCRNGSTDLRGPSSFPGFWP